MRRKNALRNMLFGVILKVYQVIVPFFLRTALIYFMGMEYVGLNSLFTSVLQVLNLAELGVGSAMIFSTYKPLAENDTEKIGALMALYRHYYRIIGGVIAVAGIFLTPFVPFLIKGDVPENINIYILYLLNLGATVLSYRLFAYKSSILQASQRNDVISKITILTNTLQYALQFFAVCVLKDYYLYVIILLVFQALTNIITAVVADKLYPHYKPKGQLDEVTIKSINQRIKDLFTAKLGYVTVNFADNIVISAFMGLTVLGVYQNYYFIMSAVMGFVMIIYNACTAGIGNSLITETKEKNFSDLQTLTFIICWLSGWCSACFIGLYQPFMEIWTGNMLGYGEIILFGIYFYVYEVNQLLNTYKDASGIWHKDRFRPLTVSAVNLCLNLLTVNFWGIYGVLLSTIVSTVLIGINWLLRNLFESIFEIAMLKGYVKKLIFYTAVSICVCMVTACIGEFTANFILKVAICFIVPNTLFYLMYRKEDEFTKSKKIIGR